MNITHYTDNEMNLLSEAGFTPNEETGAAELFNAAGHLCTRLYNEEECEWILCIFCGTRAERLLHKVVFTHSVPLPVILATAEALS